VEDKTLHRVAEVARNTLETRIRVRLDLDGTGRSSFDTKLPFLEHMLDQVARHGLVDIDIEAQGDLHIDAHHTVEDIGITLGQALARAVGDKKGIRRYGHAYVPLDEALEELVEQVDVEGTNHAAGEVHVEHQPGPPGQIDHHA
jgi:imidazoleglycerol-phosphate dehydratase